VDNMSWIDEALTGIEGLTDEVKTSVLANINKSFPINAVPKEQYNKKVSELNDVNTQLTTTTSEIDKLSKSSQTAEEYKAQLAKVNTDFETFKADTTKRESNGNKLEQLKKHLSTKFSPDAIDLLAGTFDLNTLVQSENGDIVDIDSKITALATARPSLAIVSVPVTPIPPTGTTPAGEVDTSKMSEADYWAAQRAEKKS